MAEVTHVEVEWTSLDKSRHPLWQASFCLYAYLHPKSRRILYIGKADYQTVRQRWHGAHKADIFDFFSEAFGIDKVEVLQGELVLPKGRKRSSQLVADAESLLIVRLQPPANIASTRSRVYRPGLRLKCTGDWSHRRTGFHDWR